MEQCTLDRLAGQYSVTEQAIVIELPGSHARPEIGRATRDILQLSKGSLDKVRQYVEAAKTDYRDVLYWAKYYATDPLLRDRDPKQVVDDLIRKWGDKE
jgi:hypothetical protein